MDRTDVKFLEHLETEFANGETREMDSLTKELLNGEPPTDVDVLQWLHQCVETTKTPSLDTPTRANLSPTQKMKREYFGIALALCLYLGSVQFAYSQNAYELGEEALQYGNYEQAIQYLNNAPPTVKTLIRLGFACSQLGRYTEATHIYQDVLRLAKHNGFGKQTHVAKAQALIGLGYIAYQQGKFDDAIQFYTNVVEQGTVGVSKAQHNLGKIYAGRGEISKAITAQQQAINRDPNFADAHYHLGVLYIRKQDWQSAITAFHNSLALSSTISNVHYQLARCYRQTGDVQKAEASMSRFRSLKKADTDIQKHLEAVSVADPDNKVAALVKLANTYLKYERYDEATREFERIGKHSTSTNDIALMSAGLGRIALEQGDVPEAITHYKRAVQLGLKTTETFHYLGIAYMQRRDALSAIKQFHRALRIDANHPETHLMLGTLYTTDGKYIDAERHFHLAIEFKPEMSFAYHGLAYLYGQHNRNMEKAIALARKATELSPKSASYYNTLSWLCYKEGRYDAAESAALKAIKLAPDNPIYQEGLKEILQQRK